ncbi:MBL fold metallo-hydrolase [Facklamia miroungae]|uniref:Glyoxylase, beta-lactamase superfamily II n=1 Tax=Facklamia miroungae TaxID=120956 RepID=A0A1G7S2G2_9LACT|nr:MBL fold metallo-hydrolase [Facklamia miroungae]NKZ29186.1 MBL fold metallo-hydrolase [Facklamia miroungae]SDG17217.1 Glyoxylase, beta-lactamase superfamily II [Facklamia miroungae]
MLEVAMKTVGPMRENVYVVIQSNKEVLIFDPGAEADQLIKWIDGNAWKPTAILQTHCHFDHIGGLDQLREYYKIPVYVHALESDFLEDPTLNLSSMTMEPISQRKPEHIWETMGEVSLGNFKFKVRHTPGHSPGHVIYLFDDDEFAISGDLVFAGSVGRTDLPNANHQQLMESIHHEIMTLPEEFMLYPGHGNPTLLAEELHSNPYFPNHE